MIKACPSVCPSNTKMVSPNGHCGYETESKPPGWGSSIFSDDSKWDDEGWTATCLREPWKNHDHCIWHAEVDDKPIDELVAARTEGPERLYGAYLVGVEFQERRGASYLMYGDVQRRLSFTKCLLEKATLSDANLSFIDLSNAYLKDANLQADLFGADLSGTDFEGADLSGAHIPDSNLSRSKFRGADLSGAELALTNLSEAHLPNANLSDSDLEKADLSAADLKNADLLGANLAESDLSGANLQEANLSNATLVDANLTGANLRNATLRYSSLENAILITVDCHWTDFRNARFYQAVLRDVRINSATQFVTRRDGASGRCDYEQRPEESINEYTVHPYEAAAWTYRRLQSLHEENALSERARQFHIRKEEVQRKNHYRESNYSRLAITTINKYLTKHGESLRRLLMCWLLTIITFGILYMLPVGGVEDRVGGNNTLTTFKIESIGELFSIGGIETFGRALYFSTITFTTIGYANVAPHGILSRILVGFESLIGAIMIALFVYVLGRRIER